jgi:multiple sugar transport system ATP-binding protein
MNFFSVEQRGDGFAFFHDGAAAVVDARHEALLRRAGKAVLGIRPEHFAVAPDAAEGVGIVVKLVEPLGSDTLIHFDLAGASAIARIDPALRPKVGDRLSLRPQPGKMHLFDADNGQVLQ